MAVRFFDAAGGGNCMNDNLTDIRKMFLFPRIFMTLMIKYDSVYGIIKLNAGCFIR